MRHLRASGFLFLLALAGPACVIEAGNYTGRATDEWTRTYPIAAGGSVTIINVNGGIEVERSDGAVVEVRAERTARAVDDKAAQAVLAKIEMKEEVSPGSIRIETRPVDGWMFGPSHQVQYHVKIPAGLKAYFSTTNGKVHLENVTGQLSARTTNGGVDAFGVGGSLDARTTNGGVHAEMADVTGELSLRTVNGGITLRVPGSTRADVSANCVNGGIDINDLAFAGDISRRSASGTINGGGSRITAGTVNGGVRILRSRT